MLSQERQPDGGEVPLAPDAPPTGRRGFFGAGAIYMLANISSAAVPFVLLPIMTRVLDAAAYGQVISFFALITLFTATAGLGLHGCVGVRWFDRDSLHFPSFVTTCLIIVGFSTTATIGLALLLVTLFGWNFDLPAGWIALAAAVAGGNTVINMRLVLWQSQRKPLTASALQISYSALGILCSLVGVIALGLGALGRIGGSALGTAVIAMIAVWLLYRRGDAGGKPTKEHAARALRFGVPLIPHALAGVAMSTADRLVVGNELGAAAVGIYGVAAQLGMVMIILGDAFVKSYGPWMYERLKRDSQRDRYAVVGATWLSIPAFLIAALAGGVLLQLFGPLVLGARFHDGIHLVWWFLIGGACNGMYLSVAGFFFFSSRTERVSVVTGITAVIGIATCVLLVSRYGLHGGGAAYAITQMTAFVLALLAAMRLRRDLPWGEVAKAASIAMRELRT